MIPINKIHSTSNLKILRLYRGVHVEIETGENWIFRFTLLTFSLQRSGREKIESFWAWSGLTPIELRSFRFNGYVKGNSGKVMCSCSENYPLVCLCPENYLNQIGPFVFVICVHLVWHSFLLRRKKLTGQMKWNECENYCQTRWWW